MPRSFIVLSHTASVPTTESGIIGANGVLEKQLNLQITERLGALLEEAGVAVTYTRREDKLLYTEEQNIKGKRKLYDLRNRLDIAERTENALLISIHMNTYGDKSQNGLQVYYGRADAGSRRIAEAIHAAARRDLMPSNRRQPKAAGSSIFLLDRATCPAVLIECGFLSNPEECEKLCEEDYQKALSFSLFCAIMEYISTQEKGEL